MLSREEAIYMIDLYHKQYLDDTVEDTWYRRLGGELWDHMTWMKNRADKAINGGAFAVNELKRLITKEPDYARLGFEPIVRRFIDKMDSYCEISPNISTKMMFMGARDTAEDIFWILKAGRSSMVYAMEDLDEG